MSHLKILLIVLGALALITGCQPLDFPVDATEMAEDVKVQTVEIETPSWSRIADMPTARAMLAAAAVDGKVYAIGGKGGPDVLEIYDLEANTWSVGADMLTPRTFATASLVDGKIYLIGGTPGDNVYGESGANEAYDPELDTWTPKADMLTPRSAPAATVHDGKIYVIGGCTEQQCIASAVAEVYDPATDTWSSLPDMPTARDVPAAVTLNDKVYVLGGINGSVSDKVEVYDPATDKWSTVAPMPEPYASRSAIVADGKIVMPGGLGRGFANSLKAFRYDPTADAWETLPDMFNHSDSAAFARLGAQIYVLGGASGNQPFTLKYSVAHVFDDDLFDELAVDSDAEQTAPMKMNTGQSAWGVEIMPAVGKNRFPDLVVADMDAGMIRILSDFTIDWPLKNTKLIPIPAGPNSVVATDVDGDGDLDLASADGESSVYLFMNNGSGHFGEPVILDAGPNPWWVMSGDVELDGDTDLLVANETDWISLLRNNGDGTFAGAEQFDAGPNGGNGSFQLGDINGDNFPDLVARHYPDPVLSVLFNAGDGTFSAPTDYELASAPHGVTIADLNTDGMNDVIAASGSDEGPGQLQVFLNRGEGVLGDPVNYTVGGFPLDANPADLNNDGKLDLLVTSCMDGMVHGLVNNGDGAFTHVVDYAVGGCPVFTKVVNAEDGDDRMLLISDFDGTMTLLPASIFSLQ